MEINLSLTDLIELSPDPVILISEYKIVQVNDEAVTQIRADSKDKLVGKSVFDFVHKEDARLALYAIKELLTIYDKKSKIIIRILCLDGEVRRFEFSGFRLSKEKDLIIVFCREIEKYFQLIEQLRSEEEKVKAILDAFPDLIFIISKDKKITDYFTPDKKLLYKQSADFLNKNIYDVLPDYLAKLTDKKIEYVFSTNLKCEYEYHLLINNDKKYFHSTLVRKSENEVLAVIRDITSRKVAEIALESESKFNSMIMELSLRLLVSDIEVFDKVINDALAEAGNYFNVDRAYIFEFDFPNRIMNNSFEWCNSGVTSEIENLQGMDIELIPGFVNLMLGDKTYIIENLDEYDDENTKELLQSRGILSLIIHPIFVDDKCFGYVGFDSVKSLRKFSEKEINFLKIFASFLGNVFQKISKERELRIHKEELEKARLAYLNIIDDYRMENEERKQAEKELRISELRFRNYVEQTKGIIFVIHRNGLLSYVSPASFEAIGYEPQDLIGRPYTSVVHEEDVNKLILQLKKLLKEKKSIKSLPVRLGHKNGNYLWFVVQAGPIYGDNGKLKEIVGVAIDVNEIIEIRQKLDTSELRYRTLFENQLEGYSLNELIVDEYGNPKDIRFLDVNKAFIDLLGLSNKGEVIGKTMLDIWPDIEKKWIKIFGEVTLSGGKLNIEEFSPFFNKVFLVNIYAVEELKFALSFFDITERKKSEVIKKIQLNIANAIIQENDIKELLLTIRNELSQLIDTTNFFVARYFEEQKIFKEIIFIDEKEQSEDSWPSENSLSGYVINKKSPALLKKIDIESIEKMLGRKLPGTNPEIWLGVPIILKKKSIGIMVLQSYNNPNAYDQSTIDLLQTIASQLAVFIEQQEFESQIRLLSKAIEQSSVMVIITDKNNNIQFANRKFCQVTKYSLDEVIGKNPNILKSSYHSEDLYKDIWRALSLGQEWTGEILNRKKDGNLYWVSSTISPVFNSNGKITNYISIQEDITEKKKLQEKIESSEKQLRTIWEYSIDGMRLTDVNGIIVDVNPALCEMYGVEKRNFIGKPFYYFIKNYSGGGLNKFKENIISGNFDKLKEYTLELESGKTLNVELTNSVIKLDDGTIYLFSIFRDISEKKKMISDLIAAKENAEEMNRIKTQFFATMSHELRTPFMGILGYTELLREKVNDEEGIMFLDGITRSSNRMVETLTNILDLTKFESGKTERKIEQIDINLVILEICEQFKYQALKKNLSFENDINLPSDFKLSSNEKLLRSIINNLISNAIKFTSVGKVKISSFLAGNEFVIEVEDTGIGIPKEKQEIIFDEFRQVSEGQARAFEGTGLGLSLVKKFVELLGGRIEVESELNKGSKFIVYFPV